MKLAASMERETRGHADNGTDVEYDQYRAFYRDLLKLVDRHLKDGARLKVRYDAEHDIIKVTGPRSTPSALAADGLEDVMELAQATAEHHPYWGLLHHSSELACTILERWHGTIPDEQLADMRWSLQKIESALDNAAR